MALIELEHLFDLVSNTLNCLDGNAQFETYFFGTLLVTRPLPFICGMPRPQELSFHISVIPNNVGPEIVVVILLDGFDRLDVIFPASLGGLPTILRGFSADQRDVGQ